MADELGLDLEGLLRQRGWLRALARGLVSAGEVDDLLQESWLAALRAPTGARRSLRAWFAGLARNAARKMRGARSGALASGIEGLADGRPSPGEVLAQAEFQERLIAAVRALREPYRSTVLLHYFQGLPLEEVARRTGVPGSTVRTRLARAQAELRERLQREPGGGWALLVALAREGTEPAASTLAHTIGVTLMGTMLKVGGAALGVGLVVVAWKRLESAGERGQAEHETSAVNPAESGRAAEPPVRTQAQDVDRRNPVSSAPEIPSPPEVESAPRPAHAGAAPSAPPQIASSPLERWLDAIADTFLTEAPDMAGLLSLSTALAGGVTVVSGSLEVKDDGGSASGKLEAGGNLKGSFQVKGPKYWVELSSWNTPAPFPRSFTLEFTEEDGVVSRVELRVGSHPLKDAVHPIGGQELVAWRLSVDPVGGAKLHRTKMQVDDPGPASDHYLIEISDARGVEPRVMPWITGADFDPWLARLRPLRQR